MIYVIEVYRVDITGKNFISHIGTLPYRFEKEPINIRRQLDIMFEDSFIKHIIRVVV